MRISKKLLAWALLLIGLISCSPETESSLLPEYEGNIAFSLAAEAGQTLKGSTTFSVRTSYIVDCDLPEGYRLPDDLYWDYDPGYLSVYRGPYLDPAYFLGPSEPIGHKVDEASFIVFFTYPGETSIALKRGEKTLFSRNVRIKDGTVTPVGFEKSRIRDYGEDDYLVVDKGNEIESSELPGFAIQADYFANNLLLFVKDSLGALGYPFIIGDNFYFHYLNPLYPDPDFNYETEYYVMGLPKSYFANPLVHYSVYSKFVPSLLNELD